MGQVTAVVDFGTSHTVVVAFGPDLPARLVPVDGEPWFPSAVFWGRDGRGVVGKDALRLGRAEPARLERRPKAHIGEDEVLLGDAVVPTWRLVRTVLVKAVAEVVTTTGELVQHLVLTHPADWGSTRLGALLTAAQGLVPRLSTVPEPVAAAAWFATRHELAIGSMLAVLDFGGGTCDAAVVRRESSGLSVVECAGLPDLGGDDLDQRIVEHLSEAREELAPRLVAGERTGQVPAAELAGLDRFRDDVRAAKEVLSRHPQADVVLPGDLPDALLTRTEFEHRIRPDLTRAVDLLDATVSSCGLAGSDLAAVHLVGGSSRVPLLAQLLSAWADVPIRLDDQPEAVVALGAHAVVAPAPASTVVASRDPDSTAPATITEQRETPAAAVVTVGSAAPPTRRARRPFAVVAVAITAVALLGLAALLGVRGFGGTVAGTALAQPGAGPRLTLPSPMPGRQVSVPGRSTAPLQQVEQGDFVNFVYQAHVVQWRLDSFDDSAEANDALVALGNPATPGYHWVLVRLTQKPTEGLGADPDLQNSTYLVDDRGLMMSPVDSVKAKLPKDCPGTVTTPIAAGTELEKCAVYRIPDVTPITEVAVAFHSNAHPLPSLNETTVSRGARVAVTSRPASGNPSAVPDDALRPGALVPMHGNKLLADIAVVDVIEDASAYFEPNTTIILGGSRAVVVRVAARLDKPTEDLSLTEISVELEDDRGAPIDSSVTVRKNECVNPTGSDQIAGTVAHCVLFAVPTEASVRAVHVKVGFGADTRVWRLP